MSALLEMPEVRERISPISVEEYHQLGEYNQNGRRTELIRGLIIEKMSKSPLHSTIGSILYSLLSRLVPAGFLVRKDEPLTFVGSEPEADISVVHGDTGEFTETHPSTAELVFEVAVTSVALDRELASIYAEAGVKEYWIVLGRERKIEVYRRPERGNFTEKIVVGLNDTLQCTSVPALKIAVQDIFPPK